MMSFRHLRYFIVISEEKSFVAAAKRLNTVQSSLSQQMKDLEDYIGVELYERGRRIITLTAAGEVFLEEAKKTLMEADKAIQISKNLNSKNKNILKIGVLSGVEIKLPKNILEQVRNQIDFENIEIISGTGPDLIESLKKGEVDISFTRADIHSDEIGSIKYLEEDLIFLHPAHHYLNRFPYIPVKELNNIDLIIPSAHYAPELNSKINAFMKKYNLEYNLVMETENAFSTLSYVNMGLGCTILPDYIATICTEKTVAKKFFNLSPSIGLYINYSKLQKINFIDTLLEYIKKERSL